jgi:hypothetical protein
VLPFLCPTGGSMDTRTREQFGSVWRWLTRLLALLADHCPQSPPPAAPKRRSRRRHRGLPAEFYPSIPVTALANVAVWDVVIAVLDWFADQVKSADNH